MTASINIQSEKASILLIYTGGTIGMIENPETGILSFKCWKLNDSNTPVSGFSIIPIVPPVKMSRIEAFSL